MDAIKENWTTVKEAVRREYSLSDISYHTWVEPLEFHNVVNDVVSIIIPSDQAHALNYISSKYKSFFQVTITEMFDHPYDINFILEKDVKAEEPAENEMAVPNQIYGINYEDAHLNPKYKFDTFVVGSNNKFAHSASLAVAESPGEVYNPLYLYGGPGLGKTHLMHSIGHFILEQDPDKKVLYVTSEEFTNEVIESIRSGNAASMTKLREKYLASGQLSPKMLGVDANTLLYQVPGGMLSNLISQLKQAGKEDKYYDVLAEIPRVRKDFGYPPLVTPSSQIVGTQAVMNVIMGERYKTFPKESRAMLKGEYGKLPGEVNEEVRSKAGIAPEDVITCRPADLLEPELEKYREEFKSLAKSDEDVLSLALFPQVAPKFIEKRDAPKAAPAPAAPAAKPADDNAVRELYVEWKN